MSGTTDDVVVRLRLADVARFVADLRLGTLSIDEFEKKIKRAGTTAKEVSSSGGGIGIMQATVGRFKYAAAGAVLGLGALGYGIVRFAVTSTAQFEQVRVAFTNMLGSSSAADNMIKQLQAFAAWTPFMFGGQAGVARLAQQLLSVGISAQSIIPALTAIGDKVASIGGSSDEAQTVIEDLMTMLSRGVMNGELARDLSHHGTNVYRYLSESLHLSQAQVTDLVSKGKVSAAQAWPIILAGMEKDAKGALKTQSQTMVGLWSTIHDDIQNALVEVMRPYIPAVDSFLKAVDAGITKYTPAIQAALRRISGGLSNGGKFTVGIVGQIQQGNPFGAGFNVGSMVSQAIATIGEAINRLDWAKIGHDSVGGAVEFVTGFLDGVFDPDVWKAHWRGILTIGSLFVGAGEFGAAFKGIGTRLLGDGAAGIESGIGQWFMKNGGRLEKLAGPVGRWGAKFVNFVFKEFGKAWTAVFGPRGGEILNKIVDWIFAAPGAIQNGIRRGASALVGGLFRGIFTALKFIGEKAWKGVSSIGSFFTDGWHLVWTTMVGAAGADLLSFWDPLKQGFLNVINWVIDQWNQIGFTVPWGPTVKVGQIPHVGGMADGGTVGSSGLSWVGERGPELLNLPRGASVIPLPRVPEMTGDSKRPIYLVMPDGKVLAQVVNQHNDTAMARL